MLFSLLVALGYGIGVVSAFVSLFQFLVSHTHPAARQRAFTFLVVAIALVTITYLLANQQSKVQGYEPGPTFTPTTSISQSSTSTIPRQATATPSPTPVPPTPTSPPAPKPGDVLCQADASHGWSGWNGTPDWKVLNGILISDGTNNLSEGPPTIVAPCQLGDIANYAVEARIQVLNNNYPTCFGINVRGTPTSTVNGWQGYIGAVYVACNWGDNLLAFNADNANYGNLTSAPFSPGTSYHTYRVEAQDNQLRFLIDGAQILTVTSNTYTSGEQVGLWSYDAQLNVSSFKIIAL